MRLYSTGAELNSVTGGMEVSSISGTTPCTISSATKRSGSYAYRFLTSSQTSFNQQFMYAADQSNVVYGKIWLYVHTYPSATCTVLAFDSATAGRAANIRMKTDGTLILVTGNLATQRGNPSQVVPLDTWVCVELKLNGGATVNALEGRLNGVVFASGDNNATLPWARILYGIGSSVTAEMFVDDVSVNDDSGSSQNSYPGIGEKLIILRPNADGDAHSMLDTGGSAGSSNNYTLVDEVIPNDVTDYVQGNVLNAEDMYNIEASGLNIYDVINCILVSCRVSNNTADATTAIQLQLKKASNEVIVQGTAIIPNSTTWTTSGGATVFKPTLVVYNDPDNLAFNQITLDSLQIGAKVTAFGTNRIRISAVWAYVSYTPPVSLGSAGQRYWGSGFWGGYFDQEGRIFSASLSEKTTDTDSITKSVGINRSDTSTITDTIRKDITTTKNDTITITDILNKGFFLLLTDITTITDDITKAIGIHRSDTSTVTDNIKKDIGLFKTDITTITDTILRTLGKNFMDTVTVTDSIKRFLNGIEIIWLKIARKVSSWTKQSTNNDDWTTIGKSVSTGYTKTGRNTSGTFTKQPKKDGSWTKINKP